MDPFLPAELRAPTMSRWLTLTNWDGKDIIVNLSMINSIEEYEDNPQHPEHPYAKSKIETNLAVWFVREDMAYIQKILGVN